MKNHPNNTRDSLIVLGLIGAPLIGLIWTLWMLAPIAPIPAPLAVVVSVAPTEIQPRETQYRQSSVRLKRADCQTYQCLEPLKKRNNTHE